VSHLRNKSKRSGVRSPTYPYVSEAEKQTRRSAIVSVIALMLAVAFALAFSKSCQPDGKQHPYYTGFRSGNPTLVVPSNRNGN